MAYNLSALTAYVDENRLPLIGKATLASQSAKLFSVMTDVKGKTNLNLFNTNVVFGDGSTCGWNASGDTAFSARLIDAKPLKVNMAYCDKDWLKYWGQYQVKVAAGLKNLPFEEYITESIVESVQEKIEKLIYQGVSGSTTEFEGLLSILNAASGETVNVSEASGTSAYTAIKDVFKAMPEAVKEKNDAAILVSANIFDAFIQDLVSANLYHYNPDNDGKTHKLPGTNVDVIKVNGLNGTSTYDYILAGSLGNFFYGTDAEGDEQKFDLWYSKDNREYRLAIEFIAGVQVAYPSEIVVGKIAK